MKTRVLLSLFIVLLLVVASAVLATAQEEASQEEATISEEYSITINDVGDAHIENIIKYLPDDFEFIVGVMDESPDFFTRGFTADTNIGEVENFKTELDNSSNSINISFDTPGYSYNMEKYWAAYGFPVEPKKVSDNKFEYEETFEANGYFTLYTDQIWHTKNILVLPEDASGAKYNEEDGSMEYKLPAATMGFFSENRSLLLIVFGAGTLLFLALFFLVLTRKTAPLPAATGPSIAVPPPGTTPGTRTSPTAPPAGPPPPGRPAPPQPTPAAPAQPPTVQVAKAYCKNCGTEMVPGKKFCTRCGEQG